MERNFSITRLVVVAGLVLLAGSAWAVFGPTQIGGPASYVVTEGNSMEPLLHEGDLVVVKERDNYGEGDVVAYHSRSLGRIVLHRIVGGGSDGYTLKGDNNTYTDGENPTKDQIIGRKWATVSGGGRVIGWFRQPRNASMTLGAVGLLLFASLARPLRRKASGDTSTSGGIGLDAVLERHRGPVVATAAVLFVALTVGAILAARQPTGQTFTRSLPYEHRGTFGYSAKVPKNTVYPSGAVRTGQPIFTKLVDEIELSFEYELDTQVGVEAIGTGALWVLVSDDAGWVENFPLEPDASFDGTNATLSGTLDLREVRRKIDEVQRLTGVYQDFYKVEVAARVDIAGDSGGAELSDRFTARLPMTLDPLRLAVTSPDSDPAEIPKLLEPTQPGEIEMAGFAPGDRSLLLVGLPLLGALLCLVVMVLVVTKHRASDARPALPAGRFQKWIVPVRTISSDQAISVELESLDALADLARRSDKVIFHVADGGRYCVEAEGVLYWYSERST